MKTFPIIALLALFMQSFAHARSNDREFVLAKHWAPMWIAANKEPHSLPVRYDGDGDWDLSNNLANFEKGNFDRQPTFYYEFFETSELMVLVYSVYNVQDSRPTLKGAYAHEHDNEGALLFIRKDGSKFGRLFLLLTRAHHWLIPYTMVPSDQKMLEEHDASWFSRKGEANVDFYLLCCERTALSQHDRSASIEIMKDPLGEHPRLFIAPALSGHGVYKANTSKRSVQKNLLDGGEAYVSYQLLPIQGTLVPEAMLQKRNGPLSPAISSRFVTELATDFDVTSEKFSDTLLLPRFFKTAGKQERKSNPFWDWDRLGVDPVGYLMREFPSLAEREQIDATTYVTNAYFQDSSLAVNAK